MDDATMIFDWCRWEWEIEGNYGVWDDDFRFEVYSLTIPSIAKAKVSVNVAFGENTRNESKDYFRNCLSLPEKIQVRSTRQ